MGEQTDIPKNHITGPLDLSLINNYECTTDQELQRIQQANYNTRARHASGQPADAATLYNSERRADVEIRESIHLHLLEECPISCRSDLKRRSLGLFKERRLIKNNRKNNNMMSSDMMTKLVSIISQ